MAIERARAKKKENAPQGLFSIFVWIFFFYIWLFGSLFLFCFVLFCFVLFCFVLFCFVLFCFVLFCFIFSSHLLYFSHFPSLDPSTYVHHPLKPGIWVDLEVFFSLLPIFSLLFTSSFSLLTFYDFFFFFFF